MKKWLVGCVVWAVAGLGAGWAENTGHRRAVADLFAELGMGAVMEQTVASLAGQLMNAVEDDSGYHDAVDAFVKKYIGWDALRTDVENIYMQYFSEEEIRALIAFYQSPAGKKFAALSPAIAQELSALVHRQLTDNQDDLIQMMMDADFMVFKKYLDETAAPQPSGE